MKRAPEGLSLFKITPPKASSFFAPRGAMCTGNLEFGGGSTVSTLVVSDSAVPGPVWPDSKDSSSKPWSDLKNSSTKPWSDPKNDSKAWPDSKVGTHGSLPLRAGHVASQIQKLNIQLNQQESARVVRSRELSLIHI